MIVRKLHYIANLNDTAEGKNDCMRQRLQKVLAEREKAGEHTRQVLCVYE